MQKSKLDVKTILNIVLIIILAIISFVLVVGYIISSVDPNHSITGYSIAISFVGVFATFGGAYLGAKISGDNARNLEIDRQNREKNETTLRVKTLLKMNLDKLNNLHEFICDFYMITRGDFLLDLIKNRKELYNDNYSPKKKQTGEFKTSAYIENYLKNMIKSVDCGRNIYNLIDDIDDLIKEITKDLMYLEEKELQIIFQLKQTLQILKSLIDYNSKKNVYTLPNIEEQRDYERLKVYFMHFSILFIDLNEIILNIDLKSELEQSEVEGQVKETDL
ncbi:hypothetical protein KJB49_05095 [Staphylococcus chromogenes]|uniref:hypothetical protein n=1 Tax=Staphylococcus chromogenes TaxID=46126 RepID=UPI000D033153|nr:hypothetical protein [Staphylococcus chromogenes]MCE4970685.1 hypothetical protein [Staphylococcus chromogenes]MDY3277347.1 hypothetical protein [Staphylococcus chromogenes]